MEQKIREQIIALLIENQKTFLSGEEMSRRIGCSRAAIWKHIQELKEVGYQIKARPRHGYQLQYRPDRLAPEEISYHLTTEKFGRKIRYFLSIPTTQAVAHQWAKEGAPEGAMVIAEEQTQGKGRLGHQWFSPTHQGIWGSLILRPPITIRESSHFTLLASLAVSQAIQEYTQLPIEIKWPNDLLIAGKKVCGILTELKGEQDRIDYMVIGMGINVTGNWSEEFNATSLAEEWGKPILRAPLLAKILFSFEQYYQLYLDQGFMPIKHLWEQSTQFFGKTIVARTPTGPIRGVAERLNHDGALVLRTKTGMEEVYTAEIEW